MNFKIIIQSHLPSLTKSEVKVAEYILNNSQKVLYQTLQDISHQTQVGEATVLRFCNKIGCEKFANLKLMIAQNSVKQEQKKSTNLLDFIESDLVEVIENSRSILNEKEVENAVMLIEKAKRIWFFGVGSSGLSAKEAEAGFLRIGIASNAIVDPHFQTMAASTFTSSDLVFAFSISGATKDIFDSCSIAKEFGANIIIVTNYVESPIAKISNCVLLTAAKEHVLRGGTLGGTVSQLYVIDVVKAKFTKKHIKPTEQLKGKIAKSLLNKSL